MEISGNAFSSGVSAIQSGQRRVEQAASDIARNAFTAPPPTAQPARQTQVDSSADASAENRPDLTESLVALRVGQHEAQAGAKLVKTADEVLGTLIDTTA
jgi:flagellar hook protein FlgE